jgi:hypothetical protein
MVRMRRCKAAAGVATLLGVGDEVETTKRRCSHSQVDTLHVQRVAPLPVGWVWTWCAGRIFTLRHMEI